MNPVHGLVLGIAQGLAEFLPISSSAHLVLVPWLLGWPEHSLTFDVALHMGTLAALLVYFWRDLWILATAWLPERDLAFGSVEETRLVQTATGTVIRPVESEARRRNRRLGLGLVVGSVPAALVGATFADQIEASLRAPAIVANLLIAAGVLLAAADRAGIRHRGLESIGILQAIAIGVAQTLALAPGVSRSGITLAAALFLGLTREAAARYVFLLGVPITAGAGLFQLRHLVRDGIPPDERAAFALGILASMLVGVLAIGGLLRYLRQRSLDVFVGYRIVLALFVLVLAFVRAR
ncbi:MAG: undecaprenyl-diphosphate phosphatase [Chloroflexota bacterium]